MMGEDARFEEGAERPMRLSAVDAEDLGVIAALVQDAVLTASDVQWSRKRRRLALLVNRFRWEDRQRAEQRGRDYERVRSTLVIESVTRVAAQGVDPADRDAVLSILTLEWHPGADGAGRIEIVLAGDGAIAVDVECIDLSLTDVTRPYAAPSRHVPQHGD